MGRHRHRPSPGPHRALVAAFVATSGVLTVSDSGAFVVTNAAEASQPLPAVQPTEVLPVVDPAPADAAPQLFASVPVLKESAPAKPETVTVAAGASLDSIARANGTTWTELYRRNLDKVSNPEVVKVGQVLSLTAPLEPMPKPPAPVAEKRAPAPELGSEAVGRATRKGAEKPDKPADAVPESAVSSDLVSAARSFLGVKYRYGGKVASSGLDCSGLVFVALKKAGMAQPYRTSGALREWARPIPKSQARAGDLVFGPGHVGIYLGGGMMIDAPHTGSYVGVHKVYSTMTSYGRIPA